MNHSQVTKAPEAPATIHRGRPPAGEHLRGNVLSRPTTVPYGDPSRMEGPMRPMHNTQRPPRYRVAALREPGSRWICYCQAAFGCHRPSRNGVSPSGGSLVGSCRLAGQVFATVQ
jgi:hypothetical protein